MNLPSERAHIPDGMIRGDYDDYCARYEQSIKAAGGIDLQILGIGRNGHIGFNEPTSSLASRTRLKALSRETIEDNRQFFRFRSRNVRNARSPWASEPSSIPPRSVAGIWAFKSRRRGKSHRGPNHILASALPHCRCIPTLLSSLTKKPHIP